MDKIGGMGMLKLQETAVYADIIKFMEEYKDMDYKTIKENLRAKRKELGLTPKFFEQKLGIPSPQYQHFEKLSAKSKPSVETLIKLCYAMNISILDLLKGGEDIEEE